MTEVDPGVPMKVGDLARRSGLTVRTLHHYDEIGLLKPSGRSESGYRLYCSADVARLHGIQALRHLGLSLADIGPLLDGAGAPPQAIVRQQLNALDRQIAQAQELRAKLALIHDGLALGGQPETKDWLEALALMTTFGKYFSAVEIKVILDGWRSVEDEWLPLMAQVRAAMDAGQRPDSPAVQPLVRHWMSLVLHAMGGDFSLMERWGEMYQREPYAHGRSGAPPSDMIAFVQEAGELRLALMRKYLTQQEMERVRYVPESCWREIQDEGARLMAGGHTSGSEAARALAGRWLALFDQLCDHDPGLRLKIWQSHAAEPLLAAGSALSPDVRNWLMKSLDPHAT
jgi:DNA-binding transcriptional MerR regulator